MAVVFITLLLFNSLQTGSPAYGSDLPNGVYNEFASFESARGIQLDRSMIETLRERLDASSEAVRQYLSAYRQLLQHAPSYFGSVAGKTIVSRRFAPLNQIRNNPVLHRIFVECARNMDACEKIVKLRQTLIQIAQPEKPQEIGVLLRFLDEARQGYKENLSVEKELATREGRLQFSPHTLELEEKFLRSAEALSESLDALHFQMQSFVAISRHVPLSSPPPPETQSHPVTEPHPMPVVPAAPATTARSSTRGITVPLSIAGVSGLVLGTVGMVMYKKYKKQHPSQAR